MSELAKKIIRPIEESILVRTSNSYELGNSASQNIDSLENSRTNPELNLTKDFKEKQIQDLEIKNQELQKYIESNLELENFAYIASHDLKAPLRTVMSFSQLLQKNHYACLNGKGKQYLDIISTASQDMICLIDDLLKYSEISSTSIVIADSNINSILQTLLKDLKPQFDEVGATITCSSMPVSLTVDKQRIYQLFSHIIDNSVKFRSESPLHIQISSEELKDHWLFKIADNGIGIPSQFAEKAFELFKKHKTNDNRAGSGVGLTLSKAIVRQHDGKIWIESKADGGNVTCFMISKNLEN